MQPQHNDSAFAPLISSTTALIDRFIAPRVGWLLHLGWIAAIAVFFTLAADSLIGAPRTDLSTFIYVAQGIPDGQLPYLDRWDHKGLLTYLMTLAGLSLGGIPGIWLLGVVFLLGSTWFAFKTAKEAFGLIPSLVSCTLFLVSFAKFADGGGLTEHYAMLFQFLALYLFLKLGRVNQRHEVLLCLAIGVLGAAAFLLKANLIGVWLAIGAYWAARPSREMRRLLWAVAGGLAVLSSAALAMVVTGMWSAFWSAAIVYNLGYSDASLFNRLGVWRDLRGDMLLLSLPLAAGWFAGLYYLLSGKAGGKSFEGLLSPTLILCAIELVLVTVSGYQYNHYYLALLPAFTLVIAFFAWFVVEQRLVAPAFLAFALLISVYYYSVPSRGIAAGLSAKVDKYADFTEVASGGRYANVAKRVRQETKPGDFILSWGHPAIYVHSEREAPMRFFTQFPLINLNYANEEIRNEFISGVLNSRPAMIVDTGDYRLPPLDVAERKEWVPSGRRHLAADSYQEFFDLVDAEYEVVGELGGSTLYGRRGRE